jgi:hypothetical protein
MHYEGGKVPSVKPLRFFVFVLICASFALVAPARAGETYASNEGSYSVNFPSAPEETVREIGPNKLVAHAIRNGDVLYVAAHGDFTAKVDAGTEMNANIDNYTREVKAKVTSRLPFTIERGGRTLEGIQFTYDGDRQAGKGVVVVDGTSSYLVAASSIKPAQEMRAVDEFVNSFRLAPKE